MQILIHDYWVIALIIIFVGACITVTVSCVLAWTQLEKIAMEARDLKNDLHAMKVDLVAANILSPKALLQSTKK